MIQGAVLIKIHPNNLSERIARVPKPSDNRDLIQQLQPPGPNCPYLAHVDLGYYVLVIVIVTGISAAAQDFGC